MASVDDTDQCPLSDHCATCARAEDLAVGTIGSPVGVYCVTLCGDCGAAEKLPSAAPRVIAAGQWRPGLEYAYRDQALTALDQIDASTRWSTGLPAWATDKQPLVVRDVDGAGWAATMDLVAEHCRHLGINVDQMGALLAAEEED